jgi:CHAD domain-containing protein
MKTSTTPRDTTRLLQRAARALKRHLPSAVAGNDRGVHQARVASRRLREAVPVLATGLKGGKAGKARRKIRRLTRALGTVRELDVTLRILDELARADGVPRPAVEAVRARVIEELDSGRDAMLKRLGRVNLDKLHRRLRSVADALDRAEDEPWREALGARLLKRAERLSAAIANAGQMYAPDRLHAVRIASKKLRYGLEIAAALGAGAAAPHVRVLERAQDLLGRLHDLQVLHRQVGAADAVLQPGAGVSPHGLDALAHHIERECRHLHGRYVAMVPELGEIPASVTLVIAPHLTRPARRRPLKMALPRAAAAAGEGRR